MKMNIHRAQELIEPLKNGTAEGISQHWQARLIEALEYVIEHESAQQSVQRTCVESPYGTHQYMDGGAEAICVFCGASR